MAEDPAAPSFVRLARAYRREGRAGAARDVVLAGLEANPEHVDAHALLALIHVEDGERQQARDEWETVLRLDPGNFDASRGLGFLALERGDLAAARRHLDTAARARPDDPSVTQARKVLDRRERASPSAGPAAAPPGPEPAPGRESAPDPQTTTGPGASAGSPAGPGSRNPARIFASLASDAPFRGALVLDSQGLVLAGRLEDAPDRGELLGALLNTAVAEATRTSLMLGLGEWRGLFMESEAAAVHVTALAGGAAVVVVAERDAPAGWVVRTAARATELARSFLREEQ